MSALPRLAALLRERGGMIATLLDDGRAGAPRDAPGSAKAPGSPEAPGSPKAPGSPEAPGSADAPGPAQVAARGPRASADPAEYELLIEAIYEGYLLHYSTPRLVQAQEADLALLAGDQLYALGLARLMSLGDLVAVAELADVITLCALAHGAGCPALAEAVWQAGAVAIGWGASAAHAQAKELARAGSGQALAAMRSAAARA